jgi:hypothetical protein
MNDRDAKGSMSMTPKPNESAASRRGGQTPDRGSRRLLQAIDARRRLNHRPAHGRGARKTDPFGPREPRFAYLTHSHD